MLDLPPGCRADDLERLADWAEATVLLEAIDLSKYELMESLEAGGLAGLEDETFEEDLDEFGREEDETSGTALERLAEDVLNQCRERALTLGPGYPFRCEPDLLAFREGVNADSYAFLLIADLGHHYPQLKDALKPDTASGRLMEKIVEAALTGIFGHSQRFGWPREPGWPTGINERVATLAEKLGLAMNDLTDKTHSDDNDLSLDVVGIFTVSNSSDGSFAVLTQCASGQNWKDKTGEPSVEAWQDLLVWNCKLIRAVALPWRLGARGSDWAYHRAWRRFGGAMILDRPRLVYGNPDAHLDESVRAEVAAWWWAAVQSLPRGALRV